MFSFDKIGDRNVELQRLVRTVCEIYKGYDNAEKQKKSICLTLTKIPYYTIDQEDLDEIEKDIEEDEDLVEEKDKEKERKKQLKKIERTKISVINKARHGKPVPNTEGVKAFIEKLYEENEAVSIFSENLVLFDPNKDHKNIEKHD